MDTIAHKLAARPTITPVDLVETIHTLNRVSPEQDEWLYVEFMDGSRGMLETRDGQLAIWDPESPEPGEETPAARFDALRELAGEGRKWARLQIWRLDSRSAD